MTTTKGPRHNLDLTDPNTWYNRKKADTQTLNQSKPYLVSDPNLKNPIDTRKLPTLSAVQDALIDKKLHRFIAHTWPLVEPGAKFMNNWHIEAIADHLQAVYDGKIRRLIINIPPRCGKTLLTAVFFPAWAWAQNPHIKWIFASHKADLAITASMQMRRLIDSQWYQQRYAPSPNWSPDKREEYAGVRFEKDQNAKGFYQNTASGQRIATSVTSGLTGQGADIIVVDDPHDASEAITSEASRKQVQSWWGGTLSTRLNPGSKWGAKVVIMQRLHEDDLVGHILRQRDEYLAAMEDAKKLGIETTAASFDPMDMEWDHLCLPAEYIPAHPIRSHTALNFQDPRQSAGDLLWEAGLPRTDIASKRAVMGSYAASGQFDQLPAPPGGGMLKKEWFRQIPTSEWPQGYDELIQAWDLSYSDDPTADFTVGFVIGRLGAKLYLVRRIRRQLSFTDQLRAIRAMTEAEPDARAKYIEKAANARAAGNTLDTEIPGIILIPATDSKVARAMAWSPTLEAGNIHVPKDAPWLDEFFAECENFPNGKNDDQVDAAGLGILQLINRTNYNIAPDTTDDNRTRWGE